MAGFKVSKGGSAWDSLPKDEQAEQKQAHSQKNQYIKLVLPERQKSNSNTDTDNNTRLPSAKVFLTEEGCPAVSRRTGSSS